MAQTFYEQPKVMYLKNERGSVSKHDVIGETSRSWLTGYQEKPKNWAKKDYQPTTQDKYELCLWADNNRYRIAQEINYRLGVSPAMLKQIAELIGYKEPEGK